MSTRLPACAAALVSSILLLPQVAAAEGLYVKALGGLSWLQDDSAGRGGAVDTDAAYQGGFATGGAVGYGLTSNFAAEVEFMYRTADLDAFDDALLGTGGDYASAIVSLHAVYTFDGWYSGATGTCRPFIGVGLGLVEEIDFDVTGGASPQAYEASGDVAWQVRAGADWAFAKDWSLTAELRYLDVGTPSLEAQTAGADLEAGYSTIDLLVGLTYRF